MKFALALAFAFLSMHQAQAQTPMASATPPPVVITATATLAVKELPKEMKGRWTLQSATNFQFYSNTWTVSVDEQSAGTIRGKLSFYGVSCVAVNTPMVGEITSDGTVVITAVAIGRCGKGVFRLTPGQDGRKFLAGTFEIDGAAPGAKTVDLNPA